MRIEEIKVFLPVSSWDLFCPGLQPAVPAGNGLATMPETETTQYIREGRKDGLQSHLEDVLTRIDLW